MTPKQDKSRSTSKLKYLLVSLFVLALSIALTRLLQPRTLLAPLLPLRRHAANMASTSYEREHRIALLAVQRAALLTQQVYATTAKGTVTKADHSPVTVGDFGAQALIIKALKHNFPEDEIVAEEEAADVRADAGLREKVWGYVKATQLPDAQAEQEVGGAVGSEDELLQLLDAGQSPGGRRGRIWTLDPIDGTKGFLRGGQYAIALALLVDGDVRVGALGCPNLPIDDAVRLDAQIGHDQRANDTGRGVLISATLGSGSWSQPLAFSQDSKAKQIHMREVSDVKDATFCESVEAAHSDHGTQADVARALGITQPSVRMDSQAKYASISRGAGDIYLRLRTNPNYREKIWDHAAGDLVVREAGGVVTDARGERIDFGAGRTFDADTEGVVAAPRGIHATVLAAVQKALGSKL